MEFRELELQGCWLAQTEIFHDSRGSFREFFKYNSFSDVSGIPFHIAQANTSISTINVIRGIHYSTAVQGQAKWVTCLKGKINDVAVDLRAGSITYGQWISVELTPDNGRSLYIGEGFGHGFSTLEPESIVAYLLSSEYSPGDEFGINPLDSNLSIDWRLEIDTPILSDKDLNAPNFSIT